MNHFECDGTAYLVAAYGTSKLDVKLQSVHHVLDVPTEFLTGTDIGFDQGVIHFLCDHLAIVPLNSDWVYLNFSAQLGIFKESQQLDSRKKNLFVKFQAAERVLNNCAIDLAKSFLATKMPGLKLGSKLR